MLSRPTVVIGVGHPYRRDDAVGLAVLEHLAEPAGDLVLIASTGEATELMAAWEGAGATIIVDALCHHDARPGRIHRIEVDPDTTALDEPGATSSHGIGLGPTLALARALGRAPARLTVYAIEVEDVAYGIGLSAPVADAARTVADRIRAATGPR